MTHDSKIVPFRQAMLAKVLVKYRRLVNDKTRALPRKLLVGDYFSGTGSFGLVMRDLVEALSDMLPDAANGLYAPCP